MSRLAKKPLTIPDKVEVKFSGKNVEVKGPKGLVTLTLTDEVEAKVEDGGVQMNLDKKMDNPAFIGLDRSRIANAITGVSSGFEKKLELIGVGFKAAVKDKQLDLSLGFSHPNLMDIPEDLEIKVEKNTLITISGVDKQKVGQFAASIRSLRPPEPYKGKGVRYQGEHVRRKAGKTAK